MFNFSHKRILMQHFSTNFNTIMEEQFYNFVKTNLASQAPLQAICELVEKEGKLLHLS